MHKLSFFSLFDPINIVGCLEYTWMFKLNEIKGIGNLAIRLLIFFISVCVLGS